MECVVRPVVKSAIKGTLLTCEGVKVIISEAKEPLKGIPAEAKAEIAGDAALEGRFIVWSIG